MVEERASKRQQELLSFVDGFIKGNGYGPSYREIMRALDYKSVSTVATHIDNLIAKGYLARRDNSARSLEVVSLRPSQAVGTSDAQAVIDDHLISAIRAADLTDEQRTTVAAAFEILNMKKVRDAVTPANESKTTS